MLRRWDQLSQEQKRAAADRAAGLKAVDTMELAARALQEHRVQDALNLAGEARGILRSAAVRGLAPAHKSNLLGQLSAKLHAVDALSA